MNLKKYIEAEHKDSNLFWKLSSDRDAIDEFDGIDRRNVEVLMLDDNDICNIILIK